MWRYTDIACLVSVFFLPLEWSHYKFSFHFFTELLKTFAVIHTKHVFLISHVLVSTVIPRLTKIIRSGIVFVSRNVISHRLSGVSLLAVSNVNNPVGLVCLPCVMWSAHFFVTHMQTEKINSWNGPTVHVCCFMLARASTKTCVSRIHIR
jgi:hypothetical protein